MQDYQYAIDLLKQELKKHHTFAKLQNEYGNTEAAKKWNDRCMQLDAAIRELAYQSETNKSKCPS